jgi:uncharacterized protein (TIGR02118 family)
MFYMIGTFDLALPGRTPAEAERYYLAHHVPLAQRLPGLRAYTIGTLAATTAIRAERDRGAILAFDSEEAWRAAYRSPVGRELRADEARLIANPSVVLIRGQEVRPGPGALRSEP